MQNKNSKNSSFKLKKKNDSKKWDIKERSCEHDYSTKLNKYVEISNKFSIH